MEFIERLKESINEWGQQLDKIFAIKPELNQKLIDEWEEIETRIDALLTRLETATEENHGDTYSHWSDKNPRRWRLDTFYGNCPDCGWALAQGDDGELYCPDCGETVAEPDPDTKPPDW